MVNQCNTPPKKPKTLAKTLAKRWQDFNRCNPWESKAKCLLFWNLALGTIRGVVVAPLIISPDLFFPVSKVSGFNARVGPDPREPQGTCRQSSCWLACRPASLSRGSPTLRLKTRLPARCIYHYSTQGHYNIMKAAVCLHFCRESIKLFLKSIGPNAISSPFFSCRRANLVWTNSNPINKGADLNSTPQICPLCKKSAHVCIYLLNSTTLSTPKIPPDGLSPWP